MDKEPPDISLLEAARRADVAPETVREWCVALGIGTKNRTGWWRVDPDKLAGVIERRSGQAVSA